MNRAQFDTAGERMCARTLEKEMRAGVPHYKPGQLNARMLADEEVLFVSLSWVDALGNAVYMPVFKDPKDEKWCTMGVCRKAAHQVVYPPIKLDKDYEIPEKTVRFLNEAEESWRPNAN